MNEVQQPGQIPPRIDKFGLSAYYQVGIRTLENWLARGVIAEAKKGTKLEFDLEECDHRLLAYQN